MLRVVVALPGGDDARLSFLVVVVVVVVVVRRRRRRRRLLHRRKTTLYSSDESHFESALQRHSRALMGGVEKEGRSFSFFLNLIFFATNC